MLKKMPMVLLLLFGVTSHTYAASEPYINSIGMEFAKIPSGSFLMGTGKMLSDLEDDQWPKHLVTITKSFYIGKYEVTQAQWEAVMGSNPSEFQGAKHPVENISWNDVQEFIKKLNAREKTTKYRLPTEAEWEYSARADTDTPFFFSDDVYSITLYAWFRFDKLDSTRPVGQKLPNPFGLYDIYGNVAEWVHDTCRSMDRLIISKNPAVDPQGLEQDSFAHRVIRGGSWGYLPVSPNRSRAPADSKTNYIGFRLVYSEE